MPTLRPQPIQPQVVQTRFGTCGSSGSRFFQSSPSPQVMPPPQPTPNDQAAITQAGQRAEQRVLAALSQLPAPWQFFHAVEWRTLNAYGESVGEADVVVLHPHHGAVVIEVKAGAVSVRNGDWHYASGLIMKRSPSSKRAATAMRWSKNWRSGWVRWMLGTCWSPTRCGCLKWCGKGSCRAPNHRRVHFCWTAIHWLRPKQRC